jgi:hypothetical protein
MVSQPSVKTLPDLSAHSLCFIESPGVDFLCLIFQGILPDRSRLSTVYLYLYGPYIRDAHYECDPFFPPTKSVNVYQSTESQRAVLQISFEHGQLTIEFDDLSFHIATHELQDSKP